MVWVSGAGSSYIFEVLIPYRQENVHCKVAGFIFLWFLNGLGVWGRVNLHFWRSNPLKENVHCKVVGFIFLWFLNGLGVWGRAKLHFWSSNPLQAGKCTLQGCGFHFPVISQWFGCLGQGQVGCLGQGQLTFLKVQSLTGKCTLQVSFSFDSSMVWVSGAGSSYIFEVLIPYRQENVHCKVAGFIFLWFLNGLGVWGGVKLHFWRSNPLQAGKCTFQGCGFHFPVISQWFGCLGQGQATFLNY